MWSRVPLLRLLIPFVAGLLAPACMQLHGGFLQICILAFPLLAGGFLYRFLYGYRSRWLHGMFIILFMFGFGLYLTEKVSTRQDRQLHAVSDSKQMFLLQLNEAFEMRERSCRAKADVLACLGRDSCTRIDAGLMLYIEPDPSLAGVLPGSLMLVRAELQTVKPPANPDEFDYRKYLAHNGIFHSTFLSKNEWRILKASPRMSLIRHAGRFRLKLLSKLKANGIVDKHFGIASALLLGEDSYLDDGVRDIYARAGAMHILCVSGLHVGVIFLVLNTLLGFMKRSRLGRYLLPPVLMACIWSYALLTGLAPPVSRASCMISFFIIGNMMGRHKNAYNTLAASAMLLLMLDPRVLYSAGFQLSYSAVLGIISLQKPLEKLFFFRYVFFDRVWAITTVSIAAQVGTLPVVLYYFHQFPLYGLITNLIVIPLSSLIIYTGILLLILPLSMVSAWVAMAFRFLLHTMDTGVNLVESIPYGMLENIVIDLPAAILLALLICCISALLISKKNIFLILGSMCLLLLSLERLQTKYANLTQRSFVVYSVRGHSAYDCIDGTTHHFYADPALFLAPGKISYSIEPHWLARGLKNSFIDTLHIQMVHSAWTMPNGQCFKVMVWHGPFPHCHPPDEKPAPEYLILRGSCPFEMELVFDWLDPGLVIIDSSVPPWVKAPEGDGRFWDVREKGAFLSSEFRPACPPQAGKPAGRVPGSE